MGDSRFSERRSNGTGIFMEGSEALKGLYKERFGPGAVEGDSHVG